MGRNSSKQRTAMKEPAIPSPSHRVKSFLQSVKRRVARRKERFHCSRFRFLRRWCVRATNARVCLVTGRLKRRGKRKAFLRAGTGGIVGVFERTLKTRGTRKTKERDFSAVPLAPLVSLVFFTATMPKMKLAIVADWLTVFGGAEHVIAEFRKLWPASPLFTTVARPEALGPLKQADIRVTTLQWLYRLLGRHQVLLSLMPRA